MPLNGASIGSDPPLTDHAQRHLGLFELRGESPAGLAFSIEDAHVYISHMLPVATLLFPDPSRHALPVSSLVQCQAPVRSGQPHPRPSGGRRRHSGFKGGSPCRQIVSQSP